METAKIFQNGGSQAVRIPKKFRFETDTVYVKETAMGLLLIPKQDNFWPEWLARLRQHQWDVEVDDIADEPEQERDWDELFT